MVLLGNILHYRRARAAVLAAFVLCTPAISAQSATYKFDAGAGLGLGSYLGEANTSNILRKPGFAGELSMRYIGDTRWAVRGVLSTLSLSGSTEGQANMLPDGANYSFKSQVYELSVRGEFNFFAYGIGESYKRLRRWSPYITVGLGAAVASTGGNTYAAPAVPMGMGVKFKLKPRLNLGVEFTMTKVFNDHFDSKELADLNQIKINFYKNTDWYSRLSVSLSYEFGERCETCHYVD